jgi:hypothetical protein
MVGYQSSQASTMPNRSSRQPTSTSRNSEKQPSPLRRTDNLLRHPHSQLPAIRGSPSGSPALMNGHEKTFPPTPPSNSRESVPHMSQHLTNGASAPIAHRAQDHASSSQRSPPTPDKTPPAPLSPPQRLIPSRTSGSIAESFKTAREDPWISADDVSTIPDFTSFSVREEPSVDRDLGLGFEEDIDHTPTQSTADFKTSAQENESSPYSVDRVPNREWDTNLMRNITVRRKRNHPKQEMNGVTTSHQPVKPISYSTTPDNSQTDSPTTPRGFSSRNNESLRRVSNESYSQDDYGSRRFSGISNSSTIVEAIIISTPPPKPRKLRHVSKTLSLRSDADSTSNSPRVSSNRVSLDSSDQPLHRPSQPRSHLADRRLPGSNSDTRMRVSTDPLLRHQRDSYSLRSDAESAANGARGTDTSTKRRSASAQLPLPIRTGASHYREISTDLSPLGSPTSTSYSASSTDHKSRKHSHTRESTKSPSYNSIRNSTQKALQNALGPAIATFPSSTNDSLVTVIKKQSGNLSSTDKLPNHSTPIHVDPIPDPVQNEVVVDTDNRLAPPLVLRTGSGLERRLSDASGRSFDRSEFSARRSMDRSTVRSDPRHLYSQNTPFSQISAHDALEVSEATAINIYPHNNHSLLLVQQGAQGLQPEAESTAQNILIPGTPEQPLFAFQPSTPPQENAEPEVDSPLKNPRKPPRPPQINILPATPAQDEKDPLHEAGSLLPQRRRSLLQRARRYSDNIMQPILSRSTSLRRRNSERSGPKKEDSRDMHLHPFWHPRDFWEEFSDSDSEFGDGEGHDRLPLGGDTSDPPPPSLPRRLTQKLPGFRGTGGFLIGNSLGLNRHGTNVRRHHINLPANFDPKLQLSSGDSQASNPRDESLTPSIRRLTTKGSLGSLRSAEAQKRRMHRQWKSLGLHIEYVGVGGMRDIWRNRREKIREQKAEKRRDEIRRSIGPKFLIENGATVGSIQ